jgi:hypothetical protein
MTHTFRDNAKISFVQCLLRVVSNLTTLHAPSTLSDLSFLPHVRMFLTVEGPKKRNVTQVFDKIDGWFVSDVFCPVYMQIARNVVCNSSRSV